MQISGWIRRFREMLSLMAADIQMTPAPGAPIAADRATAERIIGILRMTFPLGPPPGELAADAASPG
jgi:hypothetical protein